MSREITGLILGGFLPALMFGISGVMQKICQKSGIGTGWYMVFIGIAVLFIGIAMVIIQHDPKPVVKGSILSILLGLIWGCATVLIAVSIRNYGIPISKLAPLYNINTLITVLFGFLFFSEWKEINPLPLLCGAILVVVGSILAARA